MLAAILVFLARLEALIPLASKLVDLAIRAREDARTRAVEQRKQSADAKFEADMKKISDATKP